MVPTIITNREEKKKGKRTTAGLQIVNGPLKMARKLKDICSNI